jgi:hypothetical protein
LGHFGSNSGNSGDLSDFGSFWVPTPQTLESAWDQI